MKQASRSSQDPASSVRIAKCCDNLHQMLNGLPRLTYQWSKEAVPRNGIYIVFERGEEAHGVSRIVRVGTHTGENQLRSRLRQHFAAENKDRSIFRKHVGRCLLNRDEDDFLKWWNIDCTSRAARVRYSEQIDQGKKKEIERRVTEYMQVNLSFAVFPVATKAKRLALEAKIVSTVSLCSACGPSAAWLGSYSPIPRIKESGLWQVNQLYGTPLEYADLAELLEPIGPNATSDGGT